MTKLFWGAAAALLAVSCTSGSDANLPKGDEVLSLIDQVNTRWQAEHPLLPADSMPFHPYSDNSPFWHNAAYHTGNMEVYKLTGNQQALQYSRAWAESNLYMGATSSDTAQWKYRYGETDKHVLFGDWQICFQTYCDLYEIAPDQRMIARAREVMEYQMSTPASDYWWWADGLYMVMPVMTKLYKITGNELYLDKLNEYWLYAKDLMYDNREMIGDTLANQPMHLFYRDGKYIYPKHKTASGKKDFWARGCGWVVAGLAKVLQDMPADCRYREEFLSTYREMCQAVRDCQQPEGYWTRSLLDPEQAPGPETSGTAFFTYGLLWGINNGILDREQYLPCVLKAWQYMTQTALQKDGLVGYVQPIGERAIPGQQVTATSTANFGVGAFLLAACEMYRLVSPGK
ncbi:MAG: glycoside hydrolase family 88 protein [Bacteroidales bacterium]|nr:glycoside hydrolase family 88 protein [Bacteroidales bacterium]